MCNMNLEYCRLCQQVPGSISFAESDEFIEQVFECTKIKINDIQMDLLPKTVCHVCKGRVERFFSYIQKVRGIDEKLHDQCLCIKLEAQLYDSCTDMSDYIAPHKTQICENLQEDAVESNKIKPNNEPLQNLVDIEMDNDTNELKLSDIIGSAGLQEEQLEVEFAADDCNNEKTDSEVNDEAVCYALDGVATSRDKKHKKLRKVVTDTEIESKGNYSCNICGEKYLYNTHLRAHQKVHGNSFPCSFKNCRKVCTSAYSLETHMMKHRGKMPFLCSTCGKGLTTRSSLKCHEKIHAKVKEYICNECKISFSIRNTLRAHQKKEHEGVRYYCCQCARAFTSKGTLERHELVHGGVRDFGCDLCEAKFYTNKELLNHQRYHKGIKLFKCEECYKTFFERHHLTVHRRWHTGERPYSCQVLDCGKSFVDSQSLSYHKKSRHTSAS